MAALRHAVDRYDKRCFSTAGKCLRNSKFSWLTSSQLISGGHSGFNRLWKMGWKSFQSCVTSRHVASCRVVVLAVAGGRAQVFGRLSNKIRSLQLMLKKLMRLWPMKSSAELRPFLLRVFTLIWDYYFPLFVYLVDLIRVEILTPLSIAFFWCGNAWPTTSDWQSGVACQPIANRLRVCCDRKRCG